MGITALIRAAYASRAGLITNQAIVAGRVFESSSSVRASTRLLSQRLFSTDSNKPNVDTGSTKNDSNIGNTQSGSTSSDTPLGILQKELATKDSQLKELKDSYLMVLADMENLRQRTKREVEAASQFAIQRFCKDIVGIADILEMALLSSNPEVEGSNIEQSGQLRKGVQMTLEELYRVFARHGVTTIDPLHQRFDPNLHNALYEIPLSSIKSTTSSGTTQTKDGSTVSPTSIEPGMIVKVQKKGYLLHHRVIRPADVGVARQDG